METIPSRIAQIAEREHITIGALEKSIGASKGVLSRAIQGGTDIQAKWVANVVENYPQYSTIWLCTGSGNMVGSVYDRINFVLDKEGISKRDFEKGNGGFIIPGVYHNAELNPADLKIAQQWVNSLLKLRPMYSETWLLYGIGKPITGNSQNQVESKHKFILRTDRKLDAQEIPLYDLSATAGLVAIFNEASLLPEDYLHIPNLPPVDGAIYVRGESMTPLLKSGDIIIYKKMELSLDSILWGQIYLLSFESGGDSFTVVKYIRKADNPKYIRLVSQNPEFEDKDIPLSSIRALALVKASVTFHTME